MAKKSTYPACKYCGLHARFQRQGSACPSCDIMLPDLVEERPADQVFFSIQAAQNARNSNMTNRARKRRKGRKPNNSGRPEPRVVENGGRGGWGNTS